MSPSPRPTISLTSLAYSYLWCLNAHSCHVGLKHMLVLPIVARDVSGRAPHVESNHRVRGLLGGALLLVISGNSITNLQVYFTKKRTVVIS